MDNETVFTLEATPVKFGMGASLELGWELQSLALQKVVVFLDPNVAHIPMVQRILSNITAAGITSVVYSNIQVEPSLESLEQSVGFVRALDIDGYVAIGGGSTIDTAKVANLVATHGGSVMDYVNPPIGLGKKPPTALKPLIAIPTTSGSGSEATTVAVLDVPELGTKTGISHRFMRPTKALVDPQLATTAPAGVTAAAGLDVVCHAAESFLALPFEQRPKPNSPAERPPYQGANPVADVWSSVALQYGGRYLAQAVDNPNDTLARGRMMLAATMAGIGFGSAGVHIPHACAYPIAGLRHTHRFSGYEGHPPLVPHGISVIVTAPAAFRFTYAADPHKHHQAAAYLLGQPIARPNKESLPSALLSLMQRLRVPMGLADLGYGLSDIPALVQGALKQQRLLAIAPQVPTAADLEGIFRSSMRNG